MRAGVKTRKLYVSVLGGVYDAVMYRHHGPLGSGILMVMTVPCPVASKGDAILHSSRNNLRLTSASSRNLPMARPVCRWWDLPAATSPSPSPLSPLAHLALRRCRHSLVQQLLRPILSIPLRHLRWPRSALLPLPPPSQLTRPLSCSAVLLNNISPLCLFP